MPEDARGLVQRTSDVEAAPPTETAVTMAQSWMQAPATAPKGRDLSPMPRPCTEREECDSDCSDRCEYNEPRLGGPLRPGAGVWG